MNKPETYAVSLLKELVAFDTSNPPGNEKPLAGYISDVMESLGFSVSMVPCGENRSSVIGIRGSSEQGAKLLLNGHLDVVPASDNWSSDPFVLRKDGDRLYGRGTADMKGGIAAMLAAVKRLCEEKFAFENGQLILAFVADEELHNKGTLSLLDLPEVRAADIAVIGEPTSLEVCVGHRGTARSVIRVNGKPAHSSEPHKGVNAVAQMAHVICALDRHNEHLSTVSHPVIPSPSLAVVMIEGGEKDNIIPGHCDIRVDRRTLPGETEEMIVEELKGVLDSTGAHLKEFSYDITPYIFLAAGVADQDSLVVRTAQSAYSQVFGHEAVLKDFKATCEQSIFLDAGIDTIIFGPGSIDQAHIDDEFTTENQLAGAVDFYYTLIKKSFAE